MSKPRRLPQRMCVACRQMKDKRELARVVRSPEGWVFVDDEGGKSAGRGAYLCRNAECLAKARRSRALERALNAQLSEDVYGDIAAAIARSSAQSQGEGHD